MEKIYKVKNKRTGKFIVKNSLIESDKKGATFKNLAAAKNLKEERLPFYKREAIAANQVRFNDNELEVRQFNLVEGPVVG